MATSQSFAPLELAAKFMEQIRSMEWYIEQCYGEYLSQVQTYLETHTHILKIRDDVKCQIPDRHGGIPIMVNVFRTEEEQNQYILDLFQNIPNLANDLHAFSALAEDCLDTVAHYWNQ